MESLDSKLVTMSSTLFDFEKLEHQQGKIIKTHEMLLESHTNIHIFRFNINLKIQVLLS